MTEVSNEVLTTELHIAFTEPSPISLSLSIPGYLLNISASVFVLPDLYTILKS